MSVNTKMTAIADAIRAKTGGTAALSLDAMAEAIAGLGSGLSDDIEEINYGTYEHASSGTSGSIVSVEHGLSGKPHLFVAIIDADYSTSIGTLPSNASIISFTSPWNAVKIEGGGYNTLGVSYRLNTSGSVVSDGSSTSTDTKASIGRYIKYGAVYRWIAVRFKQNEQTL